MNNRLKMPCLAQAGNNRPPSRAGAGFPNRVLQPRRISFRNNSGASKLAGTRFEAPEMQILQWRGLLLCRFRPDESVRQP